MSLEFDSKQQLFRVTIVGHIELRHVMELMAELLHHPEFRPGMPAIWDANDADLSDLQYADLQQMRIFHEQHAAKRGRARVALVATSDMAFGVGRMVEQVADLPHIEFNVFRDMAAAEAWARAGTLPA